MYFLYKLNKTEARLNVTYDISWDMRRDEEDRCISKSMLNMHDNSVNIHWCKQISDTILDAYLGYKTCRNMLKTVQKVADTFQRPPGPRQKIATFVVHFNIYFSSQIHFGSVCQTLCKFIRPKASTGRGLWGFRRHPVVFAQKDTRPASKKPWPAIAIIVEPLFP